ncbi:VWFA-related domain-containing protein [Granulicella rosea]|uniref:VWFA-related domain-containing protein n=1 Tax=Granulicella rosea TaxID=474952 RepID=A0A239LS43_9BACT|nr:VWA domain-containing protein [Granulicella rosea]SNT32762.1 VWFA-related domain-containing protein [Granulicella rosea]
MTRHPFLAVVAAALAVVLSRTAPAQDSEPYTLKVQSQIVVLDVVVTDKHGALVQNLTKDDFEVLENKLPQPIRTVEHTTPPPPSKAPVAIESTADLDRLEPNAPVSIIVLDEMNTRFEDEEFARYSLKRYLNGLGETLSQPAMLIAVNTDHLMVLRDYTTSRAALLSALEHHLAAFPWNLQSGARAGERFNAAFASLMEIAEATSGHAGHKNMVWIGRGFPSIDMQTLPPDFEDSLKDEIQTCTNLLRDARVTLYTVDPAGITVQPQAVDADGFELDPFGGQVNFNDMARATGGRTFHNRNDVDALIGDSIRDGSDFYTLSYTPSNIAADEKPFRSIRVVMKDKDLRATTRAGYYAQPPIAAALPANPLDPASAASSKSSRRLIFDLQLAGAGTMVYDGLPFTIARNADKPNNFELLLSPSKIAWKTDDAGKLTANIVLFVESFDRKGKLLQRTADTFHLNRPDGANDKEIRLSASIPTATPAARLRFVLRVEADGRMGANNFYLVDPATLDDPATGMNRKIKK